MAEKNESTGPGGDNLAAVSRQYRTAAGLGERTSDEPESNKPPAERIEEE